MKAVYKILCFDLDVNDIPPSAVEYWNEYWRTYAYDGWEKSYGNMEIRSVNFERIVLWPHGKIEAWFKTPNGSSHHFSWGDQSLTDSEEKALKQKMRELQND